MPDDEDTANHGSDNAYECGIEQATIISDLQSNIGVHGPQSHETHKRSCRSNPRFEIRPEGFGISQITLTEDHEGTMHYHEKNKESTANLPSSFSSHPSRHHPIPTLLPVLEVHDDEAPNLMPAHNPEYAYHNSLRDKTTVDISMDSPVRAIRTLMGTGQHSHGTETSNEDGLVKPGAQLVRTTVDNAHDNSEFEIQVGYTADDGRFMDYKVTASAENYPEPEKGGNHDKSRHHIISIFEHWVPKRQLVDHFPSFGRSNETIGATIEGKTDNYIHAEGDNMRGAATCGGLVESDNLLVNSATRKKDGRWMKIDQDADDKSFNVAS